MSGIGTLLRQQLGLPADPLKAAAALQQHLLFACSGIADAVSAMEQVPGWFSQQSGAALFTCGLLAPEAGSLVEIGSFKGRSTVVLGKALKALNSTAKLYAIDPHSGSAEHQPGHTFSNAMPESGSTYDEFLENIRRHEVSDSIVPLRMTSEQAAAQWEGSPLRLLFIDGDHSIAGCTADFLAWEKYVAPGGLILLHDVGPHFPGPMHVVNTFLNDPNKFLNVFQVDSLHIALKRPS